MKTAVEQAQEAIRENLQWQTARAELEEERKRLDGKMMEVAKCLGCVAGRSEYVEVDGVTYRVALDNGKPRMEAITIRGR